VDLYQILGIEPDASQKEIKAAYKALAQQLHPDKDTGDAKRFEEIALAYAILKDQDDRDNYDRTGSTEKEPSLESKAETVLSQMFVTALTDENAIYSDIIGTMRSNINIQMQAINIKIVNINKKSKLLAEVVDRLVCKNEDGMLMQTLVSVISTNSQALESAAQDLMTGEMAIVLLEDYKFDAKERSYIQSSTIGSFDINMA